MESLPRRHFSQRNKEVLCYKSKSIKHIQKIRPRRYSQSHPLRNELLAQLIYFLRQSLAPLGSAPVNAFSCIMCNLPLKAISPARRACFVQAKKAPGTEFPFLSTSIKLRMTSTGFQCLCKIFVGNNNIMAVFRLNRIARL